MILESLDGARLEIVPLGFDGDPRVTLRHDGGLTWLVSGLPVVPDDGACAAAGVEDVPVLVRVAVRLADGSARTWTDAFLRVGELATLAAWLGAAGCEEVGFFDPLLRLVDVPARLRAVGTEPVRDVVLHLRGGMPGQTFAAAPAVTLAVPRAQCATAARELTVLHRACVQVLARLVCTCSSQNVPVRPSVAEAPMSEYTDKIKAKIKESDLEGKLSDLVDEGEKLINEGVTKAGDLAHEKREDVEGWLTKAQATVNDKTDGKYADKVSKVRDTLLTGLDRLAQRRTGGSEGTDGTPVDPRELRGPDASADGAGDGSGPTA